MSDLSATIARLAKRHKLGKDASEPEWHEHTDHYRRCATEYAMPLDEHRREFKRRYGYELKRKP